MAIASPFPSPNFQPMIPAQTGVGLVPAAGYKAKFFAAGTDIPKTIYTDADLSVPYASPSNIAFLDDDGKALIYLGTGGYKLVLTDPNDNPVAGWTIDNIVGSGSFSTGFAANFAALAGVNTTLNTYTYIPGYYVAGDGGEGMFYNAVSSDSPDGGYIQTSDYDVTKRWFRIPDESGDVRAASFGYCGSGDLTANLLAADAYATSKSARLRIQVDPCTSSTITMNSPVVVFNSNAALYAESTSTVTINGLVEAGAWRVFSGWDSVTLANAKQESRPEWFGASTANVSADNTTAFAAWLSAGAGVFIVPSGSWHTGTFTPSATKPTIFNGKLLASDTNIVQRGLGANYPGVDSELGVATVHFNDGAEIGKDNSTSLKVSSDWRVIGALKVDGFGLQKMGTSTEYSRVGGIKDRYAASGNGVAFADPVATIYAKTIPANALNADFSALRIKLSGVYTGDFSGGFGQIGITLGAVDITASVFIYLTSNASGSFSGEATIVRLSATTGRTFTHATDQALGGAAKLVQDAPQAAFTLPGSGFASANVLTVTGYSPTGGGRSAYLNFLELSYLPEGT